MALFQEIIPPKILLAATSIYCLPRLQMQDDNIQKAPNNEPEEEEQEYEHIVPLEMKTPTESIKKEALMWTSF